MRTTSSVRCLLPFVILIIGPILAAFTLMPFSSAQNSVTLPIEVIGPDGYTKSVTVNASDVSGVSSLYLKAYSIGYPQHYVDDRGYTISKASIRLNGGSWVDVNNTVAECKYPEKEMLCINGPMHTIRFEIPISELGRLSDGANTIDFRFNYTDADDRDTDAPGDPSTGFRILDLELRNASGTNQIDGTTFEWDDPDTDPRYQIPAGYDNGSDISAGQNLWTDRNILVDYWGGPDITASCADCHAKDGRDLEYFAFSNRSIVARSEFHGLSEHEGKQIAAYIRDNFRNGLQDVDTGQSYEPPGRPWHPPYQPGLTATGTRTEGESRLNGSPFDQVTSQYWAAGAGETWVLNRDEDMRQYWWGQNGIVSQDGLSLEDVHTDSSLNVRRLPIALQYPDWNEWLPEVHPLDMYGSEFTNFTDNSGNPGPWQRYQDENLTGYSFQAVRNCMANNNDDAADCTLEIPRASRGIVNQTDKFIDSGPSLKPDMEITWYQGHYNLKRWQAAKQWELIHKYDLMDESQTVFNSGAPPLGWPSRMRDVFNHASHILSADLKGPKHGAHDPYFDTAWYDLQVVLNSGQGRGTGIKPVDWKYHFGHIYERSTIDNWPGAMRYVRSYVRLIQNANLPNKDQYAGDSFPEGWYLRHTQMGWLFRNPLGELDTYKSGLQADLFTEIARSWYLGAVKGNDWTSYPRNGGQRQIEPASTDPDFITAWQPSQETNYANTTFTIVDRLHDEGIEGSIADSLRDWGKSLWPNATNPTWDELFTVTETASQSIPLDAGWNFVSSRVVLSDSSVDQVFTDVSGLSVVKDVDGQSYLPQFSIDQIGTWSTTEGYKVHVEETQETTFTGEPVERDTPIELEAGWNLLPYYPGEPMDAATALAPIEDVLKVVRDEDGNEYTPSSGNNIGDLVPGEGYAVYVTTDTTFVYPSP